MKVRLDIRLTDEGKPHGTFDIDRDGIVFEGEKVELLITDNCWTLRMDDQEIKYQMTDNGLERLDM